MKFNSKVTVPTTTNSRRYRTLEPDYYFALVRGVSIRNWRGRAYDLEANGFVSNPNSKDGKYSYISLVPDLEILTEEEPTVIINREGFILGTIDEEGNLFSPSVRDGSGEGSVIQFGGNGAGFFVKALGYIDEEAGELSDFDTETISDQLVKVKIETGAFIPKPVSKQFNSEELTKELAQVKGDMELDLNTLVLRYNLKHGYSEVRTPDGGVIYNSENYKEVFSYDDLIEQLKENEIEFVDTFDADSSGVRLKTKNLITGFYEVSEREANENGWHRTEQGRVFLTKASAKKETATLSGW